KSGAHRGRAMTDALLLVLGLGADAHAFLARVRARHHHAPGRENRTKEAMTIMDTAGSRATPGGLDAQPVTSVSQRTLRRRRRRPRQRHVRSVQIRSYRCKQTELISGSCAKAKTHTRSRQR